MASRKSQSAPEWQVILERIESQNRMTIEAVEANRVSVESRYLTLEENLGGRIGNVENSAAIRELTARIDALSRLEERIAALEKRTA